jgi:hypothetical protein
MTTDLFERIESHQFSALVNVASGFKQFVKAVNTQDEVQRLRDAAMSPAASAAISARVEHLVEQISDTSFENPRDVALAVYLLALRGSHAPSLFPAAQRVLALPNCWWARQIADEILSSAPDLPNGKIASSIQDAEILQSHSP